MPPPHPVARLWSTKVHDAAALPPCARGAPAGPDRPRVVRWKGSADGGRRDPGGGRDRFGSLLVALAAFLEGLFDTDGLWPVHLKLWELRRQPDEHEAVSAWLATHALPMVLQFIMQGLSALQQIVLAGLVLSESLYGARRALLNLHGAIVITTPVRVRPMTTHRGRPRRSFPASTGLSRDLLARRTQAGLAWRVPRLRGPPALGGPDQGRQPRDAAGSDGGAALPAASAPDGCSLNRR